jgi:hypothetical protein
MGAWTRFSRRSLTRRWVTKYTGVWAAGLADLKRDLEDTWRRYLRIYIQTTPQRLWQVRTMACTGPGAMA